MVLHRSRVGSGLRIDARQHVTVIFDPGSLSEFAPDLGNDV
jgi:hypothetical protein